MSNCTAELIACSRHLGPRKESRRGRITGTIGRGFFINVENNQDNRRRYRQLLLETPDLKQWISGVIMYEETLFDKTAEGKTLAQLCIDNGMAVGIKVDKGCIKLAGTDGETVTQGIDGLGERCARYYAAGARFAKWRSVLHIKDSGAPTQLAIDANAYVLARYASIYLENGLVPIVEPEVLMDGTPPSSAAPRSPRRSSQRPSRPLPTTTSSSRDACSSQTWFDLDPRPPSQRVPQTSLAALCASCRTPSHPPCQASTFSPEACLRSLQPLH